RLETLVLESTYGGYHDIQPSRHEAAQQLKEVSKRVLSRGGKVLVPVFAVGRSQEVMLVLEDAMRNHQIPEVPIYLDGMIWEATAIHTAYPEYLNSQLRTQIFQTGENPFLSPMFKRVETADMRSNIIDDVEPCIVLATSGMMSGGPVLEYFKGWADNPLHALLFVGFQSEGSLCRPLQGPARPRDGRVASLEAPSSGSSSCRAAFGWDPYSPGRLDRRSSWSSSSRSAHSCPCSGSPPACEADPFGPCRCPTTRSASRASSARRSGSDRPRPSRPQKRAMGDCSGAASRSSESINPRASSHFADSRGTPR